MTDKSQTGEIATRIADSLLASGILRPETLARAAGAQDMRGGRLDQALTQLGLVAERDMAAAYARVLNLPLANPEGFPALPVGAGRLSVSFLRKARILPLAEKDGRLVVALADPLDEQIRQALVLALGAEPIVQIGVPAEIDQALARLYGPEEKLYTPGVAAAINTDARHLQEQNSDAVSVRLVNHLIAGAIAAQASDIHLEPYDGHIVARYRIDGQLTEAPRIDPAHYPALVGRIKVLAQLDMAERRKPQDGRCLMTLEGRRIDLRVSILPTLHGEGVVLRVLDQTRAPLDLELLGFDDVMQAQISQLLEQPHGIFLVCGPTGSGKTTTLYAMLRRLINGRNKIISVEDPVEYQIEGVNQIQVRPQIGLGFSEILRSVLRHDPDVIMVGEARDAETARIAIQAALTGHLVLCSLHTNDAAGAVARLADMGIEPYLLASTLRGAVAQRLVRKLCPHCRIKDTAADGAADALGLPSGAGGTGVWRGAGCAACRHSGYQGRTVISEFMQSSDAVQNLILRRAGSPEIQRACIEDGMRTLRADGLRKAASAITSVQEVLRVSFV